MNEMTTDEVMEMLIVDQEELIESLSSSKENYKKLIDNTKGLSAETEEQKQYKINAIEKFEELLQEFDESIEGCEVLLQEMKKGR